MTIIEAMRSGLPYRRKGSYPWHLPSYDIKYDKDSILADDWETKEEDANA